MTTKPRCALAPLFALAGGLCAGAAFADTPAPLPPRPPLEAYARAPAVENAVLSPAGDRIAFVTRLGERRILMDYDLITGSKAFFDATKADLSQVIWADDHHLIAVNRNFTSLTGQSGAPRAYYQAVIMDIPAKRFATLFEHVGRLYPIVLGPVQTATVGGERRIYAATLSASESLKDDIFLDERTKTSSGVGAEWGGTGANALELTGADEMGPLTHKPATRLYVANPEGHVLSIADKGGEQLEGWAVGPDGALLARSEIDKFLTWRLKFHIQDGWREVYATALHGRFPQIAGLGRDGATVVLKLPEGLAGAHYVEIDAAGHISAPLEPPEGPSAPLFHPLTKRLAGFLSQSLETKDVFFDPVLAKIAAAAQKAAPGERVSLKSFAEDPYKVILFAEGSGDAGSYYFVDYKRGGFQKIGDAHPDIPAQWVAAQKAMQVAAPDGHIIHGLLTLPPEARELKELPLVVLPAATVETHNIMGFDWAAQALASRGYVVLQADYAYSDPPKVLADLSLLVKDAIASGLVAPSHVCIAGVGLGGYVALRAAIAEPKTYRCAAAIGGVTDAKRLIAYHANRDGDASAVTARLRQVFAEDLNGAESPLAHAAELKSPLLLLHVKDDVIVPDEQSALLNTAVDRAQGHAELVEFDGADHDLAFEKTRVQALTALIAFLDKNHPPRYPHVIVEDTVKH